MEESDERGIIPTVVRPPGSNPLDMNSILQPYGTQLPRFESNTASFELGIIRCCEFVPSLRRMSVVTKHIQEQNMVAYVKGAPEVMKSLCQPQTIPSNYETLLDTLTHRGFRVITLAGKDMSESTWVNVQKMPREEIETDLIFLGFIIFENKLKRGTDAVLKTLQVANVRNVMCTGDNLLTAVCVAKESGMIHDQAVVYVPTLKYVLGIPFILFEEICKGTLLCLYIIHCWAIY